jgi:hypothetical protein
MSSISRFDCVLRRYHSRSPERAAKNYPTCNMHGLRAGTYGKSRTRKGIGGQKLVRQFKLAAGARIAAASKRLINCCNSRSNLQSSSCRNESAEFPLGRYGSGACPSAGVTTFRRPSLFGLTRQAAPNLRPSERVRQLSDLLEPISKLSAAVDAL